MRYLERVVPGLTFAQGLGRLIRLSMVAHRTKVKTLEDGRTGEVWRTGRPHRLRLIVVPSATPGARPDLVTVLPEHDGWKRREASRADREPPPHRS